jgi:hypothetical protein
LYIYIHCKGHEYTIGTIEICNGCINIYLRCTKLNVENTEGAIKDGQYIKTGKIGYTKRRKTKQRHHTINKGNNKITELRTILQRESQNS